MKKKGLEIHHIWRNWKNSKFYENNKEPLQWEYDIVAVNDKFVVLIEIKEHLKTRHIDKFIEKQIHAFQILFPDYKNHIILWAVWWLIINENTEKYAEKKMTFCIFSKFWMMNWNY